ncbi:TPA: hypothetical protein MDT29_000879 [Klebsiella pneumoniae]|nr:hypothetical protein [Klebsiella pneumoniae]HBV3020940.1 hypothetical protein [Klebsiella pneumoniae]HBV3057520.1 hypothetical protein [Klebsiella pneumoniae]
MDITVTVWQIRSVTGLDHARYGEKFPVINTVHARYPNINRVKGEPHDIQEYTNIPCIDYRDSEALNKINQPGAYCFKPDFKAIDEVIDHYKTLGSVTVIWNFDRNQYPQN